MPRRDIGCGDCRGIKPLPHSSSDADGKLGAPASSGGKLVVTYRCYGVSVELAWLPWQSGIFLVLLIFLFLSG